MCVCVRVCVRACVWVCVCVCVCVCMCECVYVCVHVCVRIYIYIYICVCVWFFCELKYSHTYVWLPVLSGGVRAAVVTTVVLLNCYRF